ncbi:MAG: hypothetical protein KDK34_19245, partial [Leptospiraceae bacterium]|nr:hypothetical protein [Leptospiraceae bacterium]
GATIIRRTREETGYQQAAYFFEWSVGAQTVRANYRLPDTDTQYEDTARGLYKRLSNWSVLRADADGSLILLHYDAYNTHASQTIPGATFKMTLYRLRPGFTLQRIGGVERPIQVRVIGRRHIALLDYTEENQMMPGYIFDTESGSMVTIEVPPVPNAHLIDEERGVLIVGGTKFGGIYVYALSDGKLLRQAPSPGIASIWAMSDNRVGFTTGYASTRFTYEVRDISSLNVIRQGPVAQFLPDFPAGKVTGYTICRPGHAQCVLTDQNATTVYLYHSDAANVPMVRTR